MEPIGPNPSAGHLVVILIEAQNGARWRRALPVLVIPVSSRSRHENIGVASKDVRVLSTIEPSLKRRGNDG
jgi:hypothetical protein